MKETEERKKEKERKRKKERKEKERACDIGEEVKNEGERNEGRNCKNRETMKVQPEFKNFSTSWRTLLRVLEQQLSASTSIHHF